MLYFPEPEDNTPAAFHTLEGLTDFLTSKPLVVERIDEESYRAMGDRERAAYDRARTVYNSGGFVFNTPELASARRLLAQSFAQNLGRNSGRTGLLINGMARFGKTTVCKALMRWVYTQYTRQYPDAARAGRVPVVYIQVPSGCTGKLLMVTVCKFLGLTVRSTESMVELRSRVVEALNRLGTQLVVVDELQNLTGGNRASGESASILKSLHNDVPATFLLAGLNVHSWAQEALGQQIGGRFSLVNMGTYQWADKTDQQAWVDLIRLFEEDLPLLHHTPGTLRPLAGYIWERTGGCIGSLADLLTGAANDAIASPDISETITKELLAGRTLDAVAEEGFKRNQQAKNKRLARTKLIKDAA